MAPPIAVVASNKSEVVHTLQHRPGPSVDSDVAIVVVAALAIADDKPGHRFAALATEAAARSIVDFDSGNRLQAAAVVAAGWGNRFQEIAPADDSLAKRTAALAVEMAVLAVAQALAVDNSR